MDPLKEQILHETRRHFFSRAATGFGGIALTSLLGETASADMKDGKGIGAIAGLPHFPGKVKRAIYLHMLGAPPQQETFDYKPGMGAWFDKDLPESIRQGQRLTTMTS